MMALVQHCLQEYRPRIAPLAVLPVFVRLQGRRAVVVGGCAPAAWKAELLAAAGAHVTVYAAEPSAEMRSLCASALPGGSIAAMAEPWSPACLAGAAVAVCAAGSDAEAEAFASAAGEAGVPYNVVDRPGFSSFQFGTIVNRSPVVVAISTDGAAPIFGQAIRRRVEAALPQSLSQWAALAGRIRCRVMECLAPGLERRRFWEAFADRALRAEADAAEPQLAERLLAETRLGNTPSRGRITLVGIRSGDPEQLTLKAVRALQSADAILFDDRIPTGVLELARREAKRLPVAGQGDADLLALELAAQGRHVVRVEAAGPAKLRGIADALAGLGADAIAVVAGAATEQPSDRRRTGRVNSYPELPARLAALRPRAEAMAAVPQPAE